MIENKSRCDSQKLLIVEPKLIRDRGHHHTQIAALQRRFPEHAVHLITGEAYDGFLGKEAAKISSDDVRDARIQWRLQHGSVRQKLGSAVRSVLLRRSLSLPGTPFGHTLIDTCHALQVDENDILIVPSANLDALESVCELNERLGGKAPRIYLRFLEPKLGDHSFARRRKRVQVLSSSSLNNGRIRLFSETEELAGYLSQEFGLTVTGGFYLPCSVDPRSAAHQTERKHQTFRLGLFGAPRPGKGYERIEAIVAKLASLMLNNADQRPIEFLLQGNDQDFGDGGCYDFTGGRSKETGVVRMTRHSDRLSPSEFDELFLSADAILLPYDVSVYGLQGSGIIQDAVAAEKAIIHTAGMSMKQFLSHGNALSATTDDEFAAAIIAMEKDQNKFRKGCDAARVYYHSLLKTTQPNGQTM